MLMTHSNKKESVLVLGGARSGKSSWALEYTETHYNSYMFLATAEVMDDEMADRVRLHKEVRGPKWQLKEELFSGFLSAFNSFSNEIFRKA